MPLTAFTSLSMLSIVTAAAAQRMQIEHSKEFAPAVNSSPCTGSVTGSLLLFHAAHVAVKNPFCIFCCLPRWREDAELETSAADALL